MTWNLSSSSFSFRKLSIGLVPQDQGLWCSRDVPPRLVAPGGPARELLSTPLSGSRLSPCSGTSWARPSSAPSLVPSRLRPKDPWGALVPPQAPPTVSPGFPASCLRPRRPHPSRGPAPRPNGSRRPLGSALVPSASAPLASPQGPGAGFRGRHDGGRVLRLRLHCLRARTRPLRLHHRHQAAAYHLPHRRVRRPRGETRALSAPSPLR